MKTKFSKIMAVLLCVMTLVSSMPAMVFAASSNQTSFTNSQLSVVTDKASTLATGITQNLYTVYDKNGDQVKMFVTTADMNVDTVELFASYKDMDPTNYGMSKLTEQVAAFNEKAAAGDEYYQGTVVAGINSSYYNMTTGKPTGTFVMNGIDVTTESEGNNYGYFAVMKDGSVKIGNKGDYSSDKGNIQEAIGIHTMLIVDGEIVSGLNSTTKYPRQTIGITADNKVILMTADGNQAPSSVGLTILEQAQVMKDLGCVWAGHLDGGGSATYASKPEGSDSFVITNKPSDGSERSVSNGFIIVSTEAASNVFNRVIFNAENEYVTPGTSVSVEVNGVSSTGNFAEIPAEITYETTNCTYVDGVFTAGNTVGDATITAMYNGEAVGSTTINVVIPQAIAFDNEVITVPFGKTVTLGMTANYGFNEVTIKAEDVKFTLGDTAIGTINGLNFTAAAEGATVTSTSVTAVIAQDSSVTATASINLGKGSEVVADFEDGTDNGFYMEDAAYNYVWPEASTTVVDSTTGKVHSGEYALAVNVDYSNSLESGYQRNCLRVAEGWDMINATRLGMWIYIPDEALALWARLQVNPVTARNEAGEATAYGSTITGQVIDGTINGQTGYVYTFEESGWHYMSIDLSAYPDCAVKDGAVLMQMYISDRDGADFGYYFKNNTSLNSNFVFYVDDVTIDYSSAVDDREAPIFDSITYADSSMSDAAVLNGQTVTAGNVVSFGATVNENTTKSNYTGLDASTAKAYVDGVEVPCTITGSTMSIADVELADGQHHVKFSICDKLGNYASIIRTINIETGSDKATVRVVPHDATLDRILLGSVYYVDIVADDVENVKSVTTVLDLNNMSVWELEHMEVVDGFAASYTIQEDENIATITITREGDVEATGETVLVSMPIRTWELKTGYKYENGTKAGQTAYTYAQFRNMKEFWPIDISVEVDMGLVTFIDDTTSTFSGNRVQVDTEMWANYGNMTATEEGLAYYNAWNGGHIHTAEAVADKAATCTEDGYTGRTFCAVCDSVVDWGTTVSATGHTYVVTDNVLKCACGEIFNGIWTDGKEYIDGVVAEGWVENSYYVDGVKLTGVNKVLAADSSGEFYYDFGEDGICNGQKFTGLFYDDAEQAYRYSKLGELAGGWIQIDDEWYYFHSDIMAAKPGTIKVNGGKVSYLLEETGKLTSGVWYTDDIGTKYYYGPDYYKASGQSGVTWVDIDGSRYGFRSSGYRFENGIYKVSESNQKEHTFYKFDVDGVCEGLCDYSAYTGFIKTGDKATYYYSNGVLQTGLQLIDGAYYYFSVSKATIGQMRTGTYTVNVVNSNGLLAETTTFEFDTETGAYVIPVNNGFVKENGYTYYYLDGEVQTGLQLIDGAYYYFSVSLATRGQMRTGVYTVNVVNSNGLLTESTTFEFDTETGAYVIPVNDGFVKENGNTYYYKDGEIQTGLQLIDGAYYYFSVSKATLGQMRTGVYTVNVVNSNGLLTESTTFEFDTETGAYIIPVKDGFVKENGNTYYYKDGEMQVGLQLIDGAYYYFSVSLATRGQMRTGVYTVNVVNSNGLLTKTTTFEFDTETGAAAID